MKKRRKKIPTLSWHASAVQESEDVQVKREGWLNHQEKPRQFIKGHEQILKKESPRQFIRTGNQSHGAQYESWR